ncbi:MAG: DNA repair protein RecN [Cyclobacteriaceae bacterium]
MIKTLSIANYALIQKLEMHPASGLNIITGETGAGKSIMLGAVGLLLGNRADTKALYADSEKCVVEGTFLIRDYQLKDLFEAEDLDYEDETIIRREISPSGKSRAFVNDLPITLDILKKIGERLMDIHSQHEGLQLGQNLYQLETLDLYAGNDGLKKTYQQKFEAYSHALKAYEELVSFSRNNEKESDYNQFLFNELEEAALDAGEKETLEQELEVLEHAEEIKTNLSGVSQLLDGEEFSINQQLQQCISLLSSVKGYSSTIEELYERLYSNMIELRDIGNEIEREQDAIEFDPERTHIVKDRLDLIFRLESKHKVSSVAELIEIREKLGRQLESFQNLDDKIEQSKVKLEASEKAMLKAGKELSDSRKNHSSEMAKAIETIIHKLGIFNGVILFEIKEAKASITGLDQVEMMFSANKGVPPKEIKHVASGGEFSRLIFAIKYLIADKTALPTVIFDEIDTGVSGEIALQMISMMKTMAQNHQVIAISHLPQFAAGGEAHYYVYKDHSSDKSVSKIKKLESEERVMEIAKMIGGDNPSEVAINSSKELLGI